MHHFFKRFLPHLLVLVAFVVISLAYFNPLLNGKALYQNDIKNYIGMAKQQNDYRDETGKETYWTNSAFGGMPTYQLGAKYPHNHIKKLDLALRFLPRPADYLFLYLLGFYVLLLVMKVDYKVAVLGALAFGFSTYLIIILGVGHNSKAHAIAYMPLVLSGIIMVFQKRYLFGALLTAVALGLEICANHFQMTYYLMLLVLVLGTAYFVDAFLKKELSHYFKSLGILFASVILAIGLNSTNILATQDYVKESTRGKSELTINPDGTSKQATSGLDKSYITQYSYGILETFNLFIPRFMGGGNGENVGKNSALYNFYISKGASALQAREIVKHAPTYWGDQPIVEAPAYIGAVVVFLFVLALFLVKGRLKWWLVGGSILALLLSWGKNLNFLTDFFIDYVPLYNKFRAVSSIQVLLELCVPVMAVFALVKLFNDFDTNEKKLKAVKYATGITAGVALLFLLLKSTLFDFSGLRDAGYRQNYGLEFINALKEDRIRLFTYDTIRTLVLVLLSASIVYFYLKKKLSQNLVLVCFGVLILFDLIGVDRRYVNNDDFISALEVNKPFQPTEVDKEIAEDKSNFRVFDISSEGQQSPGRAPYFHNSLNGYHAAKLGRFEDLSNFYLNQLHPEVLNMFNTKYIIAEDEQGAIFKYTNEEANGNAWFISHLKTVDSENEAIQALDSLNTKKEAVILSELGKEQFFEVDSTATIKVLEYKPDFIKYESTNPKDGFAVFSEMYYSNGWKATIDGNEVPILRVDYTLRGLAIPAGTHTIEFRFEPEVIQKGGRLALASSIALILLLVGTIFYGIKRKGA
ncbi:MAG: YfhO family protein [Mangrovimonas sp.]|nr:YfhO family protein [Mangrovimonas sp.]